MSQIVNYDGKLLRINPARKAVEYSTNGGTTWLSAHNYGSCSYEFSDLCVNGTELLATTVDGHVYYSTNGGCSWHRKS